MTPELFLRPLEPRRLADFEHLLSGKDFGGCYCAVWSCYGEDWEARCRERSQENLEHTRARVRAGQRVGFLAYREIDGAVVGWTGAGPKTLFPLLKDRPGSRLGPWEDSVWAIACLAIAFPHRGQGSSRRIVELVVEAARAAGARAVEAYPLDPEEEQGAYRGTRRLYESAGFVSAGSEPSGERLALRMERRLSPAEPPAAVSAEAAPAQETPSAQETAAPAAEAAPPAAGG